MHGAALAADGYVRLDGFVRPDELAAVREAVEAVLRSPHGESCRRPNNTLVPLRWDDPLVALALADAARVDVLRTATGAADLRWISGYVSIKDACSPPLWRHQDWWCWGHPLSFRPAVAQVALLCYLEDVEAGNGALRVLPGSHRRSAPIHAALPEAHGHEADTLPAGHAALDDLDGQATLAARAGDAVVLDYRLLHGTHANASGGRRDAVLLSFTPDWGGLPADVRGHLICHPALPGDGERPPAGGWTDALLPHHDGPRGSLALDRNAPAAFAIG